jgi:hypothetical protein
MRGLGLLAAWAAGWFVVLERHGGYSWHYFVHGSSLLFGGHPAGLTGAGGLQLYGSYPQYQIGPLAFVVAAGLGPFGLVVSQLFMVALGGVVLLSGARVAVLVGATGDWRRRLRYAAALFVPLWMELAVHYSHLDDALAVALASASLWAAAARRGWAGVLLGGAIAAKPWAAGFLPLLWALPPGQRRSGVLWAVSVPLFAWLPFAVADPGMVWSTSHFTIQNASDSALRVLGVHAARTPGWCRPAQLLCGVTMAALAVRRGRWPAVVLASVAVRLLLDPGTYDYYTAGALAGALIVDVALERRRWPLASTVAFAGLYAPHLAHLPARLCGESRVVTCVALLALAVAGRRADGRSVEAAHRPTRHAVGESLGVPSGAL